MPAPCPAQRLHPVLPRLLHPKVQQGFLVLDKGQPLNNDIFLGKWSDLSANLRHFFDKLSDEDVAAIAGESDKLMSMLQAHYGYCDEQAQDAWDRFMRRYGRI